MGKTNRSSSAKGRTQKTFVGKRRKQLLKPETLPVYKALYTASDLATAVQACWTKTVRLRSQSDGTWTPNMLSILLKNAGNVPPTTLKRQFIKKMDGEKESGTTEEKARANQKRRADARGVMSGYEMKTLYDWIDFMRRVYATPTRSELRAKAADILEARGVQATLSKSWVTRFVKYCKKYYSFNNPGLDIISRMPRGQDQQRAGVTPEQIARYFYRFDTEAFTKKPKAVMTFVFVLYACMYVLTINITQVLFADETGWSGYYGMGLNGVKCLTQAQYREEVFRQTSSVRDHVTLLPPVVVKLAKGGGVSAHHLTPLFVFARKYVNTKLASSKLDPGNLREDYNAIVVGKYGHKAFAKSPANIPAPTTFDRYVTSSKSGNVNSVIIFNYFKEVVVPELRALGISRDDVVILSWDLHASHASKELLEFLKQENIVGVFFPGHATNWLQLQDVEQFAVLKTSSRKDIDSWNIHLLRKRQTLDVVDFPFVIQHAFNRSKDLNVTIRGLKKCGLLPFDPDFVLHKVPGSTKTYAEWKQVFDSEKKNDEDKEEKKQKDVEVGPGMATEADGDDDQDSELESEGQGGVGGVGGAVKPGDASEVGGVGGVGIVGGDTGKGGSVGTVGGEARDLYATFKTVKQNQFTFEDTTAEDAFWRGKSENTFNRGRNSKRRPGQQRLLEDPWSLTINTRVEQKDFDAGEKLAELMAKVEELTLKTDTKGQRGKRMGKPGDVFFASDISRKRDELAEKKKADKQEKARKAAAKRTKMMEQKAEVKRLRAEVKQLKKELKSKNASKSKVRVRKRMSILSGSSEEEKPDSDEFGSQSRASRSFRTRKRQGEYKEDSESSEEQEELSAPETSENEEDESDEKEAVDLEESFSEEEEGRGEDSDSASDDGFQSLVSVIPAGMQSLDPIPTVVDQALLKTGAEFVRKFKVFGWDRGTVVFSVHDVAEFRANWSKTNKGKGKRKKAPDTQLKLGHNCRVHLDSDKRYETRDMALSLDLYFRGADLDKNNEAALGSWMFLQGAL
jgi:hypothetical protein